MSYLLIAPSVTSLDRTMVGFGLTTELFKRTQSGLYGDKPLPSRALRDWTWRDSGYCIDAPETLPAGGCYCPLTHWPGEEPPVAPIQITVQRGAS